MKTSTSKRKIRTRIRIIAGIILVIAAVMLFMSDSLLIRKSDILLFMIGGDLERDNYSATRDLQEIIRASQDFPESSCTVFLCGSETWGLPGLEDGRTYMIRISSGEYKITKKFESRCGTTAEDLSAFLKYGKQGSDLIFWGHGGAGSFGVGTNTLHDDDTLTLYEIQSALKQSQT